MKRKMRKSREAIANHSIQAKDIGQRIKEKVFPHLALSVRHGSYNLLINHS
jgi:hypothetical protein